MYNLPRHKERNIEELNDFIKKYPFAFISGCDEEHKPVTTQIPVLYEMKDGKQFLVGHMMKGMDHHNAFIQNPNVLVVFTGHHIYVSGTWYNNPYSPSTWNYMSVHAKGKVRFFEGDELEDVVRKTSLHFENYDFDSTTAYDQLPAEFKSWAMKLIVGFEIEIEQMDSVFKLSQDRDRISYLNIIQELKKRGESGNVIAAEMEKRLNVVFPTVL